jgi:hypothetical protein
MARIITTSQKKNNTIPGIAYPPTLRLATSLGYPTKPPSCRKAALIPLRADREEAVGRPLGPRVEGVVGDDREDAAGGGLEGFG